MSTIIHRFLCSHCNRIQWHLPPSLVLHRHANQADGLCLHNLCLSTCTQNIIPYSVLWRDLRLDFKMSDVFLSLAIAFLCCEWAWRKSKDVKVGLVSLVVCVSLSSPLQSVVWWSQRPTDASRPCRAAVRPGAVGHHAGASRPPPLAQVRNRHVLPTSPALLDKSLLKLQMGRFWKIWQSLQYLDMLWTRTVGRQKGNRQVSRWGEMLGTLK